MKKSLALSKSRIMNGLQCSKRLYLEVHNRELFPEVSAVTQAIFDQGNEVGLEAQKLFPDGVLIDAEYWDIQSGVDKTLAAIKKGNETLFEATITHENVSARADIFKKTGKNSWEIIEVKSTTSVKEQHLDDAAVQLWVFRGFGLNIDKVSVLHINNQYLVPEQDKLFTKVDVTKDVGRRLKNFEKTINDLFGILQNTTVPQVEIGPHCSSPYMCPLIEHCWKHVPSPSVFDIPSIGKKAWSLYAKKKFELGKINEADLNERELTALNVYKSGKRYVNVSQIKDMIQNWKWPLYFLDFESFNPAIPIYPRTRPYQQIPFQFSCHVLQDLNSEAKHFENLHLENSDPREFLARALVNGFGDQGSVVAYNKSFESLVLGELATLFPKYEEKLLSIQSRLVDPLPIFRTSVFDSQFLGSYSLKSVAPALLGNSMAYEKLEIGDGGTASQAYLNLIKGRVESADREKIIAAMLAYCRQDTAATLGLVKWLYGAK